MITILHGDDIVRSRQELERIKAENQDAEIVVLEAKNINISNLIQASESKSLFANRRLLVIENFLSKKPRGKDKLQEEILGYFKKEQNSIDALMWEEKAIEPGVLKKYFGDAKIVGFKLPAKIFNFLDSLRPGNLKSSILYLEETLALSEPSFVFYLLVRQVRYLILAKEKGIDFLKKEGLKEWQIKKFERQASYFNLESLTRIYHRLLEVDTNQKTGRGNLNLKESLEFLVLGV